MTQQKKKKEEEEEKGGRGGQEEGGREEVDITKTQKVKEGVRRSGTQASREMAMPGWFWCLCAQRRGTWSWDLDLQEKYFSSE